MTSVLQRIARVPLSIPLMATRAKSPCYLNTVNNAIAIS